MTNAMSVESFYETIRAAGLDYGGKFRCIQQLWHREHEMAGPAGVARRIGA